jgi:hypothetical protein
MRRTSVVGLVAVVAVICVGGLGFATFTSMVNLTLNESAGTVNVVWIGPSTPTMTPLQAWDECSASLSPAALTISVGNAAPGDGCTLPAADGVYLKNIGTIPATLTISTLLNSGPCSWIIADNFVPYGSTFPQSIAAGQSLPSGGYAVTIWLAAGQGDACSGGGAYTTSVYQITASAGS